MQTFKHYVKAAGLVLLLAASSCRECSLECENNVIADVTDSNGQIVTDFVVTAVVQGVELSVDCSGSHRASTTTIVEGETVGIRCRESGIFLLENVLRHDFSLTVTIASGERSFSGELVTRTVETRDVRNTDCGECTFASPILR